MVLLGIILLVVGAIIGAVLHRTLGLACAVVGLILLVLGLVDVNGADAILRLF